MPAAPPSRWKRRIRRILVTLLLSPFLLLALANLVLATPWARGHLGRRLSTRLGLETELGRVTCTPWGGFAIGDLRCLQPPALRDSISSPLLEVQEIRVYPQWSLLLRGEKGISLILIERPRLTLSLEMAASIISAGAATPEPAVAAPPPVATTVPAPGATAGTPVRGAPTRAVSPAPSPPVSASSTIGTTWVEIVDGGAELWVSGTRAASVSGAGGKLPCAGAPAFSKFQLHEVEVLDRVLARDLSFPMSWRAPQLRCDAPALRLAELQVKLSAALGVMPGIPFGIDVSVPQQTLRGDTWFPEVKPQAAGFEARLQGGGFARHPATWQGFAVAETGAVTMHLGPEAVAFDKGHATVSLQGGALQCPDIRLTGERASFLGNGQVRAGGEGTAVLRVVVPPATAAVWSERLAIGGQSPVFAPLETPDRMFIDLRWISYAGGQGIELGAGGAIVPAAEFMKLLAGGGN